jgi:hypothetical protein
VFFEQDETRRKKRALDRLRSLFATWRRAPEYAEVAWELTHNPLSTVPSPTSDVSDDEGYHPNQGADDKDNRTCTEPEPIGSNGQIDEESPGYPRSCSDADLLLQMQELYTAAPTDDEEDGSFQ